MNSRDLYKRLLASETQWFGSVREAPKVFDNVTRNHIDPPLSRSSVAGLVDEVRPGETYYEMIVEVETGELTFGPAIRE